MSKNPPIGTCPCPITGCTQTAAVHKFTTRAVRDTGRRFGGKLYVVCSLHGTLGLAAPKAMQEFILAHAKIPPHVLEQLDEPAAAPPPAATPPPARAPARAADPPQPAVKPKRPWGSVLDE